MNATTVCRHHFRWALPILGFLIFGLCFLSVSRILLIVWQLDRVLATGGLAYVLGQGVRFDVVLLAQLVVIPVLLAPLLCLHRFGAAFYHRGVRLYFAIAAAWLVFMECVTPNFILQFDFRPSALFLEYLVYPKEVFSTLIKAVPVQLAAAFLVTGFMAWIVFFFLKRLSKPLCLSVPWSAPILAIVGVLVCVVAARSTAEHRPVNPSTVAFSTDQMVNTLPLSSAYSVAYALYEKLRYENDLPTYGTLSYTDMLHEVYGSIGLPASAFSNQALPTLHHQYGAADEERTPKNLVIVLLESHGADFVKRLGGKDYSPNLDKLAQEGLWFERLYATGTRSVRGIEAVVTGFLPTPLRSVVKLGGSQYDFFTVANVYAKHQYETSFIYGGEAHFDNMKRFFSNNGFEKIIEEKDYANPVFRGSWGVSDEDLFTKADSLFSQYAASDQPFFSLVFTSSNHSPFEYPDGRIVPEGEKHAVGNAVKYADYALGQFIERAKASSYWNNTVFLIVADHSDRVYGDSLVPIGKFHIPALILGKDIQPRVISQLASQIDLLPTVLSLAGMAETHPAIGIDWTRKELDGVKGRAIMQFHNTLAFMEEDREVDRVVVFQPDQAPQQFIYMDKALVPDTGGDQALEKRALAYSLLPVYLYQNKAYRLPADAEQGVSNPQTAFESPVLTPKRPKLHL